MRICCFEPAVSRPVEGNCKVETHLIPDGRCAISSGRLHTSDDRPEKPPRNRLVQSHFSISPWRYCHPTEMSPTDSMRSETPLPFDERMPCFIRARAIPLPTVEPGTLIRQQVLISAGLVHFFVLVKRRSFRLEYQMIAVLSCDTVTIRVPSGENAAPRTRSVCPLSSTRLMPVAASQILAVLSPDAVRMRWPSGENAAL